jgi:hypothetical protein
VVRLDNEIAELANQFVLVRIVNMRGVNLNQFEFDYDLTWAGFFINANGKVYGRYGGRDAGEADARLSLAGLKYAMQKNLAAFRRDPQAQPEGDISRVVSVEQYPAAQRGKANDCIHCHQVYDFRRDALRAEGKWSQDMVWVYPLPENVGLTLDVDKGDRVKAVAPNSAAHRAGLRAGDVLQSLNNVPIAAMADAQHALHRAAATGQIPIVWQRGGQRMTGNLVLTEGWKKTDISWRGSMWSLEPSASVYGKDLTADEKKALGLDPKRLAFYQGNFVPPPARNAGIRANDVIIGIDDKPLMMNMLQFNVYIRLNFKVGDRITFNVIRNGKRMDLPMTLPSRDF